MPVYQLSDEIVFPPVEDAEDGIVAVGGDLSTERLEMAYRSGIFPWYSEGQPIIWWSPDPRFVLFPEKLRISKSMNKILKSHPFEITYNGDFKQVIHNCKEVNRIGQESTWITDEMKQAYLKLHGLGIAKSVEVWDGDKLVGGLYGIELEKVFCGESMFSIASNASKVGFVNFVNRFHEMGGALIDCQVHTDHLSSLGAEEMRRSEFLSFL